MNRDSLVGEHRSDAVADREGGVLRDGYRFFDADWKRSEHVAVLLAGLPVWLISYWVVVRIVSVDPNWNTPVCMLFASLTTGCYYAVAYHHALGSPWLDLTTSSALFGTVPQSVLVLLTPSSIPVRMDPRITIPVWSAAVAIPIFTVYTYPLASRGLDRHLEWEREVMPGRFGLVSRVVSTSPNSYKPALYAYSASFLFASFVLYLLLRLYGVNEFHSFSGSIVVSFYLTTAINPGD